MLAPRSRRIRCQPRKPLPSDSRGCSQTPTAKAHWEFSRTARLPPTKLTQRGCARTMLVRISSEHFLRVFGSQEIVDALSSLKNSLRHEAHCCIPRTAGTDWRSYLWVRWLTGPRTRARGHIMPSNTRSCPGVWRGALVDARVAAQTGLFEGQCPAGAIDRLPEWSPEPGPPLPQGSDPTSVRAFDSR